MPSPTGASLACQEPPKVAPDRQGYLQASKTLDAYNSETRAARANLRPDLDSLFLPLVSVSLWSVSSL
jgi:hypothetical protein